MKNPLIGTEPKDLQRRERYFRVTPNSIMYHTVYYQELIANGTGTLSTCIDG